MARKRHFGNVRKLASGRYQVRYPGPDGVLRPAPYTFERKGDAESWLSLKEAEIVRGEWINPDAGRALLSQFGAQWIKERPGLGVRTVELYEGLMRNHLAPYLGRHAIGDLTPAVIRTWRATRLEAGASALQVAKAYRLLRAILNTAVDDQRIRTNPCQIKGAGEERSPERSVVDIATVYALADAMEAREPRYRLLVLLAAFGSLRWNELIGLQRRDLNTKTGQVMVRQQRIEPDKGATFDGDPKSRSKRTVTLPSEVLPEVRRHLRLYVRRHPDAYVFVGPKGARPRRSNFSVIWSHVRDQVGRPDLHLHDLRHTGNQFASDTGANLRQLMARMGHSSTRAALIYLHATEDRDQAIAAGLDTMIRASRSGTGVARTEEKSIKKATTRSKKKAPGQRRGSESG